MCADRKVLSPSDELSLLSEADGKCPECSKQLFYVKQKRKHKGYEIAHIYPLNPTAEEEKLLAEEERLGEDLNDLENLIPMCPGCHTKFDKPRTVEDYRRVVAIKKTFLEKGEREAMQLQYQLRDEIAVIVGALESDVLTSPIDILSLSAKSLEDKFDASLLHPTRRKIQHNVSDYFTFVRARFQSLEQEKPGAAEHISVQVRSFYLAQKAKGWSQQQIFGGVVDWIVGITKPKAVESAEIVASFFVQNCEVFE